MTGTDTVGLSAIRALAANSVLEIARPARERGSRPQIVARGLGILRVLDASWAPAAETKAMPEVAAWFRQLD